MGTDTGHQNGHGPPGMSVGTSQQHGHEPPGMAQATGHGGMGTDHHHGQGHGQPSMARARHGHRPQAWRRHGLLRLGMGHQQRPPIWATRHGHGTGQCLGQLGLCRSNAPGRQGGPGAQHIPATGPSLENEGVSRQNPTVAQPRRGAGLGVVRHGAVPRLCPAALPHRHASHLCCRDKELGGCGGVGSRAAAISGKRCLEPGRGSHGMLMTLLPRWPPQPWPRHACHNTTVLATTLLRLSCPPSLAAHPGGAPQTPWQDYAGKSPPMLGGAGPGQGPAAASPGHQPQPQPPHFPPGR